MGCTHRTWPVHVIPLGCHCHKYTVSQKRHHIFLKIVTFCISQVSAVTFSCGGQVYNNQCQTFSGFCVPKIIKIGTEDGRFW